MQRILAVVGSVLVYICAFALTQAGGFDASGYFFDPISRKLFGDGPYGHYYYVGAKKYLNSFTSYQFQNPFPPGQDPLSRLEFPIDQWFGGLRAGYSTSGWNAEAQGWININNEARTMFQDSDWTDPVMPGQKTVFSESHCRMNRGLLFDVKLDMATALSHAIDIRPVLGWRYESFFFTTHDGLQAEFEGNVQDLPGDGIEFRQTFTHYYLGAMFRRNFDASRYSPFLPDLRLDVQLDYALVKATNEDLHLLRAGNRITQENTRGHCWHASATAAFIFSDMFRARIEADFQRLLTNGGHRLMNYPLEIDFSFDGAHVWSDQFSVAAVGEFSF